MPEQKMYFYMTCSYGEIWVIDHLVTRYGIPSVMVDAAKTWCGESTMVVSLEEYEERQ